MKPFTSILKTAALTAFALVATGVTTTAQPSFKKPTSREVVESLDVRRGQYLDRVREMQDHRIGLYSLPNHALSLSPP